MKNYFIALICCAPLFSCIAVQPTLEPTQPVVSPEDFLKVTQDLAKGNFLSAFLDREKVRASSALYGQIHAAVGWTKEASEATQSNLSVCGLTLTDGNLHSEERLENSFKDYDVVILNESHEKPRHRATAIALLPILKRAGYDIFAAEAFGDGIQSARSRGYALLGDGTYTKEPVFGHLVRSAAMLGFDMHRYEPWSAEFPEFGDDQETREKGQAHLIGELIQNYPNRKVFVLSGRGHLKEYVLHGDGTRTRLMGWYLKNEEGLNVLTISQTSCAERTEEAGLLGLEAIVPEGAQVDMVRQLSKTKMSRGRPSWLWEIGLRPVDIGAIDETQTDAPFVLVEVYNPGENLEAVPADRLVVRVNEDFTLAVPYTGDWNWRALDMSGEIIARGRVSQPA